MDGWMDGQMNGWMEAWMDGWMFETPPLEDCILVYIFDRIQKFNFFGSGWKNSNIFQNAY